jgi:hypothetical protein
MEQIIIDLIKNGSKAYHQDYKRTVKYAEECLCYFTGYNMDAMLRQFVKREDEEAFKNRKLHTQNITMSITKTITDPEHKVLRANNVQNIIQNSDTEKAKELIEIAGKFYQGKSIQNYIDSMLVNWMDTDPNAFMVVTFDEFNYTVERANPYPYIVPSSQAVKYKYSNGKLKYLIEKRTALTTSDIYPVADQYVLHLPFYSVTYTELPADLTSDLDKMTVGDKTFTIEISNHEIPYVPALRIGFVLDILTSGRTCLVFWDAAIPYLRKTIKVNSEMDLTASLIAFPKEIRYVSKCTHANCFDGRTPEGGKCPACLGTGNEPLATSAQDTITMRLPSNPQDMISLDSIYRTVAPDVGIITWQVGYIDKLKQEAINAVYSGETFSRENIAQTATGENINLQAVYDSLYPFAIKISEIWEWAHRTVAEITDLSEDTVIRKIFNKDFKMKSKDELITDLQTARAAGADSHIIESIQDDLARIIHSDNPEELNRYYVKKAHYPFSGLSEEEKRDAIAGGYIRKQDIYLAYNYGHIFDLINLDIAQGKNIDFWEQSMPNQRKVIDQKVAELINTIMPASLDIETGKPVTLSGDELLTDEEVAAQANLKGSVGGVEGLIEIIKNAAAGVITREAAKEMLKTLYGFSEDAADKMTAQKISIEKLEEVSKAGV